MSNLDAVINRLNEGEPYQVDGLGALLLSMERQTELHAELLTRLCQAVERVADAMEAQSSRPVWHETPRRSQ